MTVSICCSCGACFSESTNGSCPYCGSSKTLGVMTGTGDPFRVIESAQQCGLWDRARDLLETYKSEGVVSASDYNLSVCQIQWRRDCVARMEELQDSIGQDELRRVLYSEFDSFAANWAMDVYKGCSH